MKKEILKYTSMCLDRLSEWPTCKTCDIILSHVKTYEDMIKELLDIWIITKRDEAIQRRESKGNN